MRVGDFGNVSIDFAILAILGIIRRFGRMYTQMRSNHKRRTKKRLLERTPARLDIPAQLNHAWSFDFMSDSLYLGQRYRVLNVLDEGVREVLDFVVDTSITAQRVVQTLE